MGLAGRPGFLAFKWSAYALLAGNIGLFTLGPTPFEALDSLGWVMLLAVSEWETMRPVRRPAPDGAAIRLLRAAGYGLAGYAWWRYAQEEMWVDFANATIWLLVVAAIVADVHWPARPGGPAWRVRGCVKGGLYACLAGIAVWWGATGEVLNAYDAFLWILCFFAVEMNLLDRLHTGGAPRGKPR